MEDALVGASRKSDTGEVRVLVFERQVQSFMTRLPDSKVQGFVMPGWRIFQRAAHLHHPQPWLVHACSSPDENVETICRNS